MTKKAGKSTDSDWPAEAERTYERVTPLGQGNFGAVWMARRKNAAGIDVEGMEEYSDEYVAIKHVDITSPSLKAYAEREITILSEIKHPNIVRLVKAYEPESKNAESRLVVMSLAKGHDINKLIQVGGALGLPLGRMVARQLIAAIGYLHGRAVMHRDIKPDNCILATNPSGRANSLTDAKYDDAIWSDGEDGVEAAKSERWRVVLVDFGFARALSPEEVKSQEMKDANKALEGSPKPNRRSVMKRGSVARVRVTGASAIGTRFYAAPEISENYRKKKKSDKRTSSNPEKQEALSKCVADYGMISDSYSVGATVQEILTGVPPDEPNEESYIKSRNKRSLIKKVKSSFSKTRKRTLHFVSVNDLPNDARRLLRGLMHEDIERRLTVREAQTNPWICLNDDGTKYELPQGDVPSQHGDPVVCLKSA